MATVRKIVTLSFLLLLLSLPVYALPAFPGAEGMGASSVGGRGGTVYLVTNLNDSGTGSFRAACTASGPRIVVFKVSGQIHLLSDLVIYNPYLTIAGQTSPGGICISGGMFQITTHDVVITHMRFRRGSDVCTANGNCDNYGDTVRIMSDSSHDVYNVILDHCSIAWGCDETLDIGPYGGSVYDVTVSWSIIAQGLDDPAPESNHGYGFNVHGKYGATTHTRVSSHHNYVAHFRDRLPYVTYNAFVDWRNNVVYNWQGRLSQQVQQLNGYTTRANFISNYSKTGPLTGSVTCGSTCGGIFYCGTAGNCLASASEAAQQLYTSGNAGCGGNDAYTGWSSGATFLSNISTGFYRSSPHATTDIPVTTTTMTLDYAKTILASVGATKPSRDSIDVGFVADFTNGTGSTLADKKYSTYPTGWATYSTPTAPTDSDSDGMADSWEISTFGNLTKTAVEDTDGDGYTNIEEYLHYLGGYTSGTVIDSTPPSSPNGITIQLQ